MFDDTEFDGLDVVTGFCAGVSTGALVAGSLTLAGIAFVISAVLWSRSR